MWVFLIIVAAFCALYFLLPRKFVGISFFLLVIALSVMAYYAVPNETDDLSRYFNIINQMRDGGWERFQTMLSNNESDFGALPVTGYYFYFISLLPNNNYLPFFTILISYGSVFILVYKIAKRFNIDKFYLFLGSFFHPFNLLVL